MEEGMHEGKEKRWEERESAESQVGLKREKKWLVEKETVQANEKRILKKKRRCYSKEKEGAVGGKVRWLKTTHWFVQEERGVGLGGTRGLSKRNGVLVQEELFGEKQGSLHPRGKSAVSAKKSHPSYAVGLCCERDKKDGKGCRNYNTCSAKIRWNPFTSVLRLNSCLMGPDTPFTQIFSSLSMSNVPVVSMENISMEW